MKKITTAITALALATTAITAVAPTTTMAEYNYQTRGISEWDGRIFYETTYVVQDVKLIDNVRVINKTTGNTVEMPMLSLTEIKWNGDVMVSFNPYGDWGLSKNYDYAIEIPFNFSVHEAYCTYESNGSWYSVNSYRFCDGRESYLRVDDFDNSVTAIRNCVVFEVVPSIECGFDVDTGNCHYKKNGTDVYIKKASELELYDTYNVLPHWCRRYALDYKPNDGGNINPVINTVFGDIDNDGTINAVDASYILSYASAVGAGYTGTLKEFTDKMSK